MSNEFQMHNECQCAELIPFPQPLRIIVQQYSHGDLTLENFSFLLVCNEKLEELQYHKFSLDINRRGYEGVVDEIEEIACVLSDDRYLNFYVKNKHRDLFYRSLNKSSILKILSCIQKTKRLSFLETFCLSRGYGKLTQETYADRYHLIMPKQFSYVCDALEKALLDYAHINWHPTMFPIFSRTQKINMNLKKT